MWSGSPLDGIKSNAKKKKKVENKREREAEDSGCFVSVLRLPGDYVFVLKVSAITPPLTETRLTHFVAQKRSNTHKRLPLCL